MHELKKFFGVDNTVEDPEYDLETETNVEAEEDLGDRRNNIVSINSKGEGKSQIVLYEPRVYSDAKEVADNLLHNKAVIINFTRMDDSQSRRIVDFITGTVYSLNGKIQRIGDKIFLANPPKFETDGKIAELVDKKDNLN